MRNAPTELTAAYANGKASFTMQANMEQAYKTVYSNYHTPEGTDPKEAPFRLELKYGSADEPILSAGLSGHRERKPSPSATTQSHHPLITPAPTR